MKGEINIVWDNPTAKELQLVRGMLNLLFPEPPATAPTPEPATASEGGTKGMLRDCAIFVRNVKTAMGRSDHCRTAEELANSCQPCFQDSVIKHILEGRLFPSTDSIERISAAMNIHIAYLMSEDFR